VSGSKVERVWVCLCWNAGGNTGGNTCEVSGSKVERVWVCLCGNAGGNTCLQRLLRQYLYVCTRKAAAAGGNAGGNTCEVSGSKVERVWACLCSRCHGGGGWAHAAVCCRMLPYADVCWRMLTYADIC
jgi:hypothetical protein